MESEADQENRWKTNTFMSQLKMRIETIVWFVLGVAFLLSIPVILEVTGWILVVCFVFAAVVALPVSWAIRKVLKRFQAYSFYGLWSRSGLLIYFIISAVLAMPIYYLAIITEANPVLHPQVTLTNGKKTVVFQGMQHIGSENFYKSVIYDMEQAISDGYVIYYERVQTSTPESKEFMGKLTNAVSGGGEDLDGFYKSFGKMCGLKFQSDYLALFDKDIAKYPQKHVIADVDALELKREYERLMKTDPMFAKAHANDFKAMTKGAGSKDMSKMFSWLDSGTKGQKKIAGIVCRGFMNKMMMRSESHQSKFDPIILDYRNRALVKRITAEHHDKIFITYGARHFKGVFALLKKQDPHWKIVSVKWMRSIEAPENEFVGDLGL